MSSANSEIKSRRSIIQFLDDESFVTAIMSRYGMNIFDLFKFMFRVDSQVFKPQFATTIGEVIKNKSYYRL